MKIFNRHFPKGKCIYQSSHPLGNIFVYDDGKTRFFVFDKKSIQSHIDKTHLSKPLMAFMPPLCCFCNEKSEQTVLLLGGGGGAIYHYLANKPTMIEHHPNIISMSESYFYIPRGYVINSCAKSYIQHVNHSYSHSLVDIFSKDISPLYNDLNFLMRLFEISDEVISFNLLAKAKKLKAIIFQIRQKLSQNTLLIFIPHSTNLILHVFKSKQGASPYIEQLNAKNKIEHCYFDSELGFVCHWRNPIHEY